MSKIAEILDLYQHNIDSYKKVKEAYAKGEKIVGIVHATGTGKSFNALQLAYDNKDKKIIYVVPSIGIAEHIKEIIKKNKKLSLKEDFPNLVFKTYQSFTTLDEDEISDMECDLLILDEFHHIGAPIWGTRIEKLIETHPDMKVFGMTAYTVRDRGSSHERDMSDPETDEIFSDKIVSRYDLCDAMMDGVLPKPVYKTAYVNLLQTERELEKKLSKYGKANKDYDLCVSMLKDIKKQLSEAPSIQNLLKKTIKPNGKYIYFCSHDTEESGIFEKKKEVIKWLLNFLPEENIVVYTTTSAMGKLGKLNRLAFYHDVDLEGKNAKDKLRIMFAINQYNEGVHAPNLDGVIMGRETSSDIVFFEQLGRGLSVNGNTQEKIEKLSKYSHEELMRMCREKDIAIHASDKREDLIEKLVAPVIIDLSNNYDFIKELENNLKHRINNTQEERQIFGDASLTNPNFDVQVENKDLFDMLKYVMDRITLTWEDKYELARAYSIHHGNLLIPVPFRTVNGYDYDENGVPIGKWLQEQRSAYKGNSKFEITEDRINKLNEIGMIWDLKINNWETMYSLATKYYKYYGNLDVPHFFFTNNGYKYDETGAALGRWISYQRTLKKVPKVSRKEREERIKKLDEIGMIWDLNEKHWNDNYELLKIYYEHHGNIFIPSTFKTKTGYRFNKKGVPLGKWLDNQRLNLKKNEEKNKEKIAKLDALGMMWGFKDRIWLRAYELAKVYYEHYHNLDIPIDFNTTDGYTYERLGFYLGKWIEKQRKDYNPDDTSATNLYKVTKLNEIGMIWNKPTLNLKKK